MSFESALGFRSPCENLSREQHRLKGFEFWKILSLELPSNYIFHLTPERRWWFCHSQSPSGTAAGGSKESERGHAAEWWCPMQRKLCRSPGMVCTQAGAWGCSVGTRETPRREAFHRRRDQLWELLCQGVTFFFSESVLLKAYCFASLPFPTTKVPQETIYFCVFWFARVWGLVLQPAYSVSTPRMSFCGACPQSPVGGKSPASEAGSPEWACGSAFPWGIPKLTVNSSFCQPCLSICGCQRVYTHTGVREIQDAKTRGNQDTRSRG